MWDTMKLKDVLTATITGEWGTECTEDSVGTKVLRTTNFTNTGKIKLDSIAVRQIAQLKIDKKKLEYGDIILEKSGGSDTQPVGRVVYFDIEKGVYLCNNFTQILRPNKNIIYNRYLFYFLTLMHIQKVTELMQNKTTGIRNLDVKRYMDIEIPVPPKHIQLKIIEALVILTNLIDKRTEQINLMDKLAKDTFVEMFGDPVANPKGWDISLMGNLGTLKNGMNYSRSDRGYTIKCLGVGDFKNLYEIDDVNTLSSINLVQEPSSEYLLKDGDIVFVRSNGNKALVGRSIAILPHDIPVTFSGFCIRFRITDNIISPNYLNHALHLPSLKAKLLQDTRGCNIQNLNQQILSKLEIPIPTHGLQNDFDKRIATIKAQKSCLQASHAELKITYNSILQKAFNGELFN